MIGSGRDAVWGALGDPVRRVMVDRLRDGPATTGQLEAVVSAAGLAGATRFKSLHHLGVLREAGLVTTAEVGRERHNYLNASALFEATIGWLRPPDAALAGRLNRLKNLTETKGSTMSIDSFSIRQEITIAAPPDRVWTALIDEVGQWWGAPYLLTHEGADPLEPASIDLELPTQVGAPVVERRGDATELWGVVSAVDPGRLIGWIGAMGIPLPAWSEVRYALSDADGGTSVVVSHAVLCGDAEGIQAGYNYGWHDLNERLRAWVERSEAHGFLGDNRSVPGFEHR